MRDGGVLSRAWERWQPPPALCTAPRMVAINFHHIITAFLLLMLGVAVAVVLVPCERWVVGWLDGWMLPVSSWFRCL